jgi:L-ribulokinase
MANYSLGIDYGTSSCRAILVDVTDGSELVEAVYAYPHGVDGVIGSQNNPDIARQHPADYLAGLEAICREVITKAAVSLPDFRPEQIIAVGFATTGSTPIPVDERGEALAFDPRFAERPAALAWLWKDHTAHAEAEAITELASSIRPDYLRACGGTYSAEWFWAKIWNCLNSDPEVFRAAHSWVELCDYLAGTISGTADPKILRRSVTAAGHKAMYGESWGGLPDEEFLSSLAPELADLRSRLYGKAYSTTELAGVVSADWADRTGLVEGTPVAVGHFDAHAAGIAGGVRPGVFVKVMGTSTCDMTVVAERVDGTRPLISGMCGIVPDTMLPGRITIEAGQSAVGDIFNWWVDVLLGDGIDGSPATLAELGDRAAAIAPGEHGLLALDWFNGNRSILVDQRLTGLILGMTLHTGPDDVLRALVEATAFGARRILDCVEAAGAPISTVVAAGGLPGHAPWMIQCYANVFDRPIKVATTTQGSALGAALVASVAAGAHANVEAAQDAMVSFRDEVYFPEPQAAAIYAELYSEFRAVHDAFAASGRLGSVMKNVLAVRDRVARQV